MKKKFNFKLFHYYWLIHLFLIDLKCHVSSYPKFFYFCSKNLFIYSCANITLYLFKWLYNILWHLVGRNSPLCSFFFKLSWLFLNIYTSSWILESACQIPLKSWSGFDWDCVEFIDLLRGLRGSKNINSWHCDMASRKRALINRLSGPPTPALGLGSRGLVCGPGHTGSTGPPPGGAVGPSLGPRILVWKDWFQHHSPSSNAHWAPAGGIQG